MENLALYTGAPTLHLEDNTSCISVVEGKIVTPRVKHIDITDCFLQEQFDNGPWWTHWFHHKEVLLPLDIQYQYQYHQSTAI